MSHSHLTRPKRGWIAVAGLALSTLALSGCGQDFKRHTVYPVKGKLTYDGKAPEGAIVTLHAIDKSDPDWPRPKATVSSDGSFELKTYAQSDGAPAGKYKVTVQLRKFVEKDGSLIPGPHLVPERYATVDKSDLQIEIAAAPNELAPITLRR